MANPVLEKVEQVLKLYYTLDQTLARFNQKLDNMQNELSGIKTEIAELRLQELKQFADLDKRVALLEAGREMINAELRLSEERIGRVADRIDLMFRGGSGLRSMESLPASEDIEQPGG